MPKKYIVETKNSYYAVTEFADGVIMVVDLGQKDGKDEKEETEVFYGDTIVKYVGGIAGLMLQKGKEIELQSSVILRITELQ